MKSIQIVMVVVLVLLVVLGGNEIILSKAEGVCNMSMEDLNACKPSVSSLEPTEPSAECCSALADADLPCLCSYKHSFMLQSLDIDPDRAMQLPTKCNLTPPALC